MTGDHSYNLRVSSDGAEVSVSGTFTYRADQTPVITGATPRYTPPGVLIDLSGIIYTDKYLDTDEEQVGQEQLERVHFGPSTCNLYPGDNPEEMYGLSLDAEDEDTGHCMCMPSSTDIGSFNASMLFSGSKGRSVISKDALLVDAELNAFLVQYYPVVTGISPRLGSTEGNTLITVSGEFFHDNQNNVKVFILQSACEVVTSNINTVTCRTPPEVTGVSNLYPGQRGWTLYLWEGTVDSIGQINSLAIGDSTVYSVENTELYPNIFVSNFLVKLSGFFVAPQTGHFTFCIPTGKFYMSTSPYPDTNTYEIGCSDKIELQNGMYYYMYALAENVLPRVSVFMYETVFVNGILGSARNELQRIRTTNNPYDEWLRIEVLGRNEGNYSVQEIHIPIDEFCCEFSERITTTVNVSCENMTNCNSTMDNVTYNNYTECYNSSFNIIFQGNVSTFLVNSTAKYIEDELNSANFAILHAGGVNVTILNNDTHISIELSYREVALRETIESYLLQPKCGSNESTRYPIAVHVISPGLNPDETFVFSYNNVRSQPIPFTASQAYIQSLMEDMFIRKCTYSYGTDFLLQDFEEGIGYSPGVRRGTYEPYCGKRAVQNPNYLFIANSTYAGSKGAAPEKLDQFDARDYKYLCLAYVGTFPSKLYLGVRWENLDLDVIFSDISVDLDSFSQQTSDWVFRCQNIYAQLIQHGEFSAISGSSGYSINYMRLYGANGLYIDEVIFAKNYAFLSRSDDVPARPSGNIFVDETVVENFNPKTENNSGISFDIRFTTFECGHNFTLIEVVNDEFYSPITQFNITRIQQASPPIRGDFTLSQNSELSKAIDVQATADEVKQTLQETFQDGEISIRRVGDCRGYAWDVEWVQSGGDKPTMDVNDDNVKEFGDVSIEVTTVTQGGLDLPFIPGDMLRNTHATPQLSLFVNNIPASCAMGECDYEYTADSTPVITSIDPSIGRNGTEIHITGDKFGTIQSGIYVLVGGVMCNHVTLVSTTQITCILPKHECGILLLKVNIPVLGYSDTFSYSYLMTVTTSLPPQLSTTGGTLLTISGYNFGVSITDTQVTISSKECTVTHITDTLIRCTTPPNPIGSYPIILTIRGVTDSSLTTEYTVLSSPLITSVSPDTLSSCGGNISIYGYNFSTQDSYLSILVGGSPCVDVSLESNTHLKCTAPPHPPGITPVIVTHDTSGSGSFNVTYVLVVESLGPWVGSSLGGSLLSLTGQGFCSSPDDVMITFTDPKVTSCNVQYVNDTSIECRIASTSTQHDVDNSGYSSLYGYGYNWSPNNITILTGDTVVWSWYGGQLIEYQVVEINEDGSDVVDGFMSDVSYDGMFSHCFYIPGVFHYRSIETSMVGVIYVAELPSFVSEFEITVNGFTPSSVPSIPPGLTGVPINISCLTPLPVTANDTDLQFIFWSCKTGLIQYSTPTQGYFNDVIQITGSNFTDIQLQVTLDGVYPCDITSTTDTTAFCTLREGTQVPPCTPLLVTPSYGTDGYPLLTEKSTYILQPTITDVSPLAGSTEGCQEVTISGYGLNDVSSVVIGSECEIVHRAYNEIVCTTGKAVVGNYSIAVYTCSGNETYPYQYEYSISHTPLVNQVTVTEGDMYVLVEISGDSFSASQPSDVIVGIGDEPCVELQLDNGGNSIECRVYSLEIGDYIVSVYVRELGCASIPDSIRAISIEGNITSYTPTQGSIEGCTRLTLSGYGFSLDSAVNIESDVCDVTDVTFNTIHCVTRSSSAGARTVTVHGNGKMITSSDSFEYSQDYTPTITGLTPDNGYGGDIEITGTKFGTSTEGITVEIGTTVCEISSIADSSISCLLPYTLAAGSYTPLVTRYEYGCSQTDIVYQYTLIVDIVTFSSSSAGRDIQLTGYGFDALDTGVTVCDIPCVVQPSLSTSMVLSCRAPPNLASDSTLSNNDKTCDINVAVNSQSSVLEDSFLYVAALTSQVTAVNPARGGTGGGVELLIIGDGFGDDVNSITVLLGDLYCDVLYVTDTQIRCDTPSSSQSMTVLVEVYVANNGYSNSSGVSFEFIDVWSSIYTWGDMDIPVEGDFVVISPNQTILLDVTTPVLSFLLIQGTLIFDEADLTLNSEYILVTDGGLLQVGSEESYFKHNAIIRIHGHVRKPELPVYGTKVLAVRDGTLELHGKPIPITWSRLNHTANINDIEIVVEGQLECWEVGDEVVIAATGFGPVGNERVFITYVTMLNGITTLGIDPPLEFEHLAITVSNGNDELQLKAEVGLLTRNIVFEGSVNDEWTEVIQACPREFNHDQHATQSCFQGRFGEEIGSDQFGAHIMIHSPTHRAQARIEYVEVRHAGQAFRLGRYPIHYHINGNVSHSYVRGCAIHDTFNRAVTIHAVHGLLVEHNVAYNIKGHAFFLEDGNETGNIIRYNLAVFVRSSSSLLNVDVTPAAFWITNPDNIVSHNAAAGGTTFGYWVRLSTHPEGPSFDPKICPRNVRIREFTNNTAHSFGRYGLWIFPTYRPKLGGTCESTTPAVSLFSDFLSWHNMRGAESTETGAVHWRNFSMISNQLAGMEVTVPSIWHTADTDGGLVYNSYVASRIPGIEENFCCVAGIKTGHNLGSTFRNITFAYFDKQSCSAIAGCSHCKSRQGGWEVRWSGVEFIDSPSKLAFLWEHETVHADMDGSISGENGSFYIVPSMGTLPTETCMIDVPEYSIGANNGSYCWDTEFRRMAWNDAKPESLLYVNALVSNEYGTSVVPFKHKRLTHPDGWMALVLVNRVNTLLFENVSHVTNISYQAGFYEIAPEDDIWIRHRFKQTPDFLRIFEDQEMAETAQLPLRPNVTHGDWHFNHSSLELYYIVSGIDLAATDNLETKLTVYQCYFADCVIPVPPPPPTGRPSDYRLWSNASAWVDSEYGIEGPPVDGDDVIIPPNWWMVIDVELPEIRNLTIQGVLEFEDYIDYVLNVTYIVILGENAGLIAGLNGTFNHSIHIRLMGDHSTPELVYTGAPVIGSKVIANFGILSLRGRIPNVAWTFAGETILKDQKTIILSEIVDWGINLDILITSSSFDHYQTEIATIYYIENVNQSSYIYVTDPIQYTHRVVTGTTDNSIEYTLRPEVALLHRNIVIEGLDTPVGSVDVRDFGARVLAGTIKIESKTHVSRTFLEGVRFYHGGQYGHTDPYDPRYSLSFVNLGDPHIHSYVRSCVFQDSSSSAIGVFSSHNIDIRDNVIYGTVGDSVIIAADNIDLVHNLVVQTKVPVYFLTTVTQGILPHVTTFEISKANNLKLQWNSAAGSDYIGYHISGEHCDVVTVGRKWYGNIAHSNLHGIQMLYDDGIPFCTMVSNFISYLNWDWGVFTYTRQRMIFQNLILVDNRIGLHAIVYEPRALSHVTSNKYINVENCLFVGNSDVDSCHSELSQPKHLSRTQFWRPTGSTDGGSVGFTLATFMSGSGAAPNKPYEKLLSYSAISGVTHFSHVTFANYLTACGDRAIQSHRKSGDAMHPVEILDSHRSNVDMSATFFLFRPLLSWVDPSDCVDMDCDGPKKVLIKMLDSSFLGAVSEVVSQSEFEWGGDMRRGLGDYRIPLAMQTNNDGSRVNITETYPYKGIYREADCEFMIDWQSYYCPGVNHDMMIIESLDADTETRRISPVGLAAGEFIDLINGPMDHGWCLGYTCQERISTFYTLVRNGLNYSLAFTGTNPQVLRVFLLNADVSRAVVVGLFSPTPQRIDVYNNGNFIVPTNAYLDSNLKYVDTQDPEVKAEYIPTIDLNPGANFYDRASLTMYFVVKAEAKITLETTMVIQLKFDLAAVTVNEFFEENIVRNIALLLGIPESKIRITKIVGIPRIVRRQVQTVATNVSLEMEIGDPPLNVTDTPPTDNYVYIPGNQTGMVNATVPPATNTTNTSVLSYNELLNISTSLVGVTQSGELEDAIDANIDTLSVANPLPPPMSANLTGLNDTALNQTDPTYFDSLDPIESMNASSIEFLTYKVPEELFIFQKPFDSNETVPFGQQPRLFIADENQQIVTTLRYIAEEPWRLTVYLRVGYGDPDAVISGVTTVEFVDGWVNFTDLAISHYGEYILDFNITTPRSNLTIKSQLLEVKERIIILNIITHVINTNETVLFDPAPLIELVDIGNGQRVTNHDWKGWDWVTNVTLISHSGIGEFRGEITRNFSNGLVEFTDLSIHSKGNYSLRYDVITVPGSNYSLSIIHENVIIRERELYLTVDTQPNDCNETVVCGFQPVFSIRDQANGEVIQNVGWRNRVWRLNTNLYTDTNQQFQLNGTTEHTINNTANAEFKDLRVFGIGQNFYLNFQISTDPVSSYHGLSINTSSFDVNERVYYLSVDVLPSDCNQSVVCAVTPEVGVYDYGTGLIAPYLNSSWQISVSIFHDPSLRVGDILGYNTTTLLNSIATFINFSISEYGSGYILRFQSIFGDSVLSASFDVDYVNDYSPIFHLPILYSVSIFEENTTNITVTTYYATDLDIGSQGDVEYTLHSMSPVVNEILALNSTNGNLTLFSPLDRELFYPMVITEYELIIRAYDLAYPEKARTTDITYTIIILDINDNIPAFHFPGYMFSCREDLLNGVSCETLTADDRDDGINSQIVFSLVAVGIDYLLFDIDPITGDVFVTNESLLDFDNYSHPNGEVYEYTVYATDLGIPPLESSSDVRITLQSVNEFFPVILTLSQYNFSYAEENNVSLFVTQVFATDADYGDEGIVRFRLPFYTDIFYIDPIHGNITITGKCILSIYIYFNVLIFWMRECTSEKKQKIH